MYKVTEEDLIDEIKGFPIEVVKMMLKRQYEQIGLCDVKAFQFSKSASAGGGGFDWDDSPEGWEFWNDVICHSQFDQFFERYKDSRIELPQIPPRSQLRTMTKVEKWLLSKIKCEKALSRRDRMQYLNDRYLGELYSIPRIASNETFDWIPTLKNLSEANLIFFGEGDCANCDQEDAIADLSERVGNYVDWLTCFYSKVDSQMPIRGQYIPFGGVGDIRTVIGWIKKNLGVACRFLDVYFVFTDKSIRVSHRGESHGSEGWVKDSVGYCYRNDKLFIIGGHIFEIR